MSRALTAVMSISVLLPGWTCAQGAKLEDAPFGLFAVEPWFHRDADELPSRLQPGQTLTLEGMRNDWVVAAAGLLSRTSSEVEVRLDGPPELLAAADLKVVGEVATERQGKVTWWLDPVFAAPGEHEDLSPYIRNWGAIHEFPRLHPEPDRPILLWLTLQTDSLEPGVWKGALLAEDRTGARAEAPIEVRVHPVVLPRENPIIGYAYQTFGEDRALALMALDYGINACGYYDNWDLCHELGFRYYRFSFCHGQPNGASLDVTDQQILDCLGPIQETVTRLGLTPEQWGIEIYDEPSDVTAWAYAAWAIRIRRLWPEARIWANPGHNLPHAISTARGTVEPLRPYVTTWCPYIEPVRTMLPALKATGQPIWYYTVEFIHNRPARGGRNLPWFAWRLGLQGWAFYGLNPYGKANPWKDNVCARLYPERTASLWLEGLRQGVQDYKRLWALEQAGMTRAEVNSLVEGALTPGEDAPWGGADPPLYDTVRRVIDEKLCSFPAQ